MCHRTEKMIMDVFALKFQMFTFTNTKITDTGGETLEICVFHKKMVGISTVLAF